MHRSRFKAAVLSEQGLNTSKSIIVSLCVLHNLARANGDANFQEDGVQVLEDGVDIHVGAPDGQWGLAFRRVVIENNFS